MARRRKRIDSRMTIDNVKNELIIKFKESGIESPDTDAEWLIAALIECSRSELPLHLNRVLDQTQIKTLMKQADRRASREPLQHIFNSTNFYGLDFKVSKAALIPRPETEQLIELAINELKDHSSPSIYDFGTGSGCIAITLAKKNINAKIIASDISQEALHLAKMNADLQGVADRIEFRQADGLALAGSEKMHLIVANPPYIPTKEILTLQPEVRDFDPHMALDGGKDGLHYYRILALESQESLVEGCSLLAEFGDGQKNYINNIFHNANWKSVKFASDLSRKPRIVIASASL